MAVRFSDFLDPTRIDLDVRSARRTTALHQVADQLSTHAAMRNYKLFYKDLLARERLDSTCLGNGVALPHARTDHVGETMIAVGRSERGIYFEKADQHVNLMFVLGTPKRDPGSYLGLVSALCKLMKSAERRAAFLAATTPEAFITAIKEAETS
ncbi:PTS sugar transporter subunit IIA [Synoicihabitans lomoniglobus]|uniref:PTS sugar transporter subunit IIA n=1 Tax=Synoicihabitans lomoniglobus TaxID=2909285 RepID=A0AAE9ZY23_9BACT|nr:PTS sugar transporter subunit IIA [Opitutaceae bacterium LMO-M01]WED65439.1 PTS sugar transporter subunit IIA [Opitutaceae bacterium LMO-M01]